MQKVEGSSPFIRLTKAPGNGGFPHSLRSPEDSVVSESYPEDLTPYDHAASVRAVRKALREEARTERPTAAPRGIRTPALPHHRES
jgi:hypothetical protein